MNIKEIFGKHYERLLVEGILKSTLIGATIALLINTVFAFLYWMLSFGSSWLGAVIGIPLGIAVGILLYFLRYRLTEQSVARRIDRCGLDERMITMVELSGDPSSIAQIQRADARDSLHALSEKTVKISISPFLIAVASVILALSILFTTLALLASGGKIPYGKDMLLQGADGKFEVVYMTDGGGKIRGESSQSVGFGESTDFVRAVADDGWMFVFWDDGEKSPERREEGVSSNMVIKAVFKKIDNSDSDEDDSDSADDLPSGSVNEESGGGDSDQTGGENIKNDGEGNGGGKWQDRNQFIDGATYYRDYLEFYYQYAMGVFDSQTDIPPEIIEFFETYFSGI